MISPKRKDKKIHIWDGEFLQQMDQLGDFKVKLKVSKGHSCAQRF